MSSKKFYTDVEIKTDIILDNQTAGTVPVIDSSKKVKSSTVTETELGYLSGATSSVQTQINTVSTNLSTEVTDRTNADTTLQSNIDAEATARSAADTTLQTNIDNEATARAAGDATLQAEIDALPDPVVYKGTYDASTNTPALANTDTGKLGFLYYVSVAGSVDFGAGAVSFAIGDKVVNNGTTWDKWDMTDAVSSVFGRVGAITSQSGDYSASQVTNVPTGNLAATDIQSAVNELQSDIDTRALSSDLSTEITNRTNADTTLQTNITNETTRATGAESTIQTNLTNHISNTDYTSPTAHQAQSVLYDTVNTIIITPTASSVSVQSAVDQLDFYLSSIKQGDLYDISPTLFTSTTNNVSTPADVTGFFIQDATKGFDALATVIVTDSSIAESLVETFKIIGYHKGPGNIWGISIESTGDVSGVSFSITSFGQIQYTTPNYASFSSLKIIFRASCLSIV